MTDVSEYILINNGIFGVKPSVRKRLLCAMRDMNIPRVECQYKKIQKFRHRASTHHYAVSTLGCCSMDAALRLPKSIKRPRMHLRVCACGCITSSSMLSISLHLAESRMYAEKNDQIKCFIICIMWTYTLVSHKLMATNFHSHTRNESKIEWEENII